MDPQRIKAIKSLEKPSNKKELQRILGMLNYRRNFTPNFADLTSNMRTLLKCNVEFIWAEAHSMLLKYCHHQKRILHKLKKELLSFLFATSKFH